jgi:heme-degrading monooxygenase HmoA
MLIARTWRGWTSAANAEQYAAYVARTGIEAYRSTVGNLGAYSLHRISGDRAEFLVLSFWESLEALRAYAGDDYERAVFYPEDDAFLVDRDLKAHHWTIA